MNFRILVVLVVAMLASGIFIRNQMAEKEAFEKREAFITETNDCLAAGDWKCAERNIRQLLKETPDDKNFHLHLAGILYEQERYEDCLNYIGSLGYSSNDLDFLQKKSKAIMHEMATLGLERSAHFRVEFEGRPSKNDVLEVLSVLEVAYDSLCRLFQFYPENKMHLVLYQSAEYQGVGPRPDWVGAVFDGKLRVPVGVMQHREVYRPMLFHELTHAFVRAMTRSRVPLWINEGIAQRIDGSRTHSPRPEGTAPSLAELTEPFVNEQSFDKALRLYWYSERMVDGLFRRNPSFPHFTDFIRNLHSLGAEKALERFYSVSAEQLRNESL